MRSTCILVGVLVAAFVGTPTGDAARAADVDFEAGSLIVPMDTDYQDMGMLTAFGLVYALLRSGVPLSWVIDSDKEAGGTDLSADALDHVTMAAVSHAYRGGPFVVAAEDADVALLIVDLWQASHDTTVHVATTAFTGFVQKQLVAAPTIAVFADGNEDIAFGYLNAAGIPDSLGQPWPNKKQGDKLYPDYPDVLNVAEVAGLTDVSHSDGALFDADGDPVYCQIMTMHWGVSEVVDEVVAEFRSFLQHPVHLMAECQAVNAIENSANGHFLTPHGFAIDARPDHVQRLNPSLAFAQLDGAFETVGGSEPSYSLPPGDGYYDQDIVMLAAADSGAGTRDVWMTGFFEGACPIDSIIDGQPSIDTGGGTGAGGGGNDCTTSVGKISYLGGHRYDVALPISTHPKTQGTRLFLNSLFEADCATLEGQPLVTITKTAPGSTVDGAVTFLITVNAFGPGSALDAVVTDALPAGAAFVSATAGGVWDGQVVTWSLGNLGVGESGTVSVTVQLAAEGVYENVAGLRYLVGVSERTVASEPVTVHYSGDADNDGCPDTLELEQGTRTDTADSDGDGFNDCADSCPVDSNPLQDLASEPAHCGACDRACADPPHGSAGCDNGDCVVAACDEGWRNADGAFGSGCDCAVSDPQCGAPLSDVGPEADADVGSDVATGPDVATGSDVVDGDASATDTSGPEADPQPPGDGSGTGGLELGSDGGAQSVAGGGTAGCACGAGRQPQGETAMPLVVMLWLVLRRRGLTPFTRG